MRLNVFSSCCLEPKSSFVGLSDDGACLSGTTGRCQGYVIKDALGTELISAVQTVLSGKQYLSPSITVALANSSVTEASSRSPLETLSAREREVLHRTVEGYSSVEIGRQLSLSPKTVDHLQEPIDGEAGCCGSLEPDPLRHTVRDGTLLRRGNCPRLPTSRGRASFYTTLERQWRKLQGTPHGRNQYGPVCRSTGSDDCAASIPAQPRRF